MEVGGVQSKPAPFKKQKGAAPKSRTLTKKRSGVAHGGPQGLKPFPRELYGTAEAVPSRCRGLRNSEGVPSR